MADEKMSREDIIKDLYESLTITNLPEQASPERDYYFDEGTGTWYILTGKRRIDRPSIDLAQKYFEGVLQPIKNAKVGSEAYQKALYCAIAIEAIDYFIKNKNKDQN